jgi:RNA polymerase sigma factor (sigma-70 family)
MTPAADPLPFDEAIPWVTALIRRVKKGRPTDDEISDGMLAYLQILEEWDPSLFDRGDGPNFRRWAGGRLRLRMIDIWRKREPRYRRDIGWLAEHPISTEQPVHRDRHDGGDAMRLSDTLPCDRDPVAVIEEFDQLWWAIDQLDDVHRDIIVATFIDEETLREYGKRHGYTESRACQIRSVALAHLRRIITRE